MQPCFHDCTLFLVMSGWSLVEFERRCEFMKLQGGYMKINKSPTMVYHSFILGYLNCTFCSVCYHVGTLKNPDSFIFGDSNWKLCLISAITKPDEDISDFSYAFIFKWQKANKTLLDMYKNNVFANCDNCKISWNLCFMFLLILKVVYQDRLTQLLHFSWDFLEKGQRPVWGQVG